jgi:hypothetical protein
MSKDTVMQASGFYPDANDMECTNVDGTRNRGFFDRSIDFQGSSSVEMCGPLVSDLLFNSNGVLMPKSDFLIRMYRQPHNFCLMSAEADAGYKLKVRRIVIVLNIDQF